MSATKIVKDWSELGFYPTKTTGDVKVKGCPVCPTLGKKNSGFDVSLNMDRGIGKCHKCDTKFMIERPSASVQASADYTLPTKKNLTKLGAYGLKLFTDRKISQEAVIKHKITQSGNSVVFPYFRNGEFINAKYRGIAEKSFRQTAGAEHIIYNYDNVSGQGDIVIVEGEFDVLAWETAGIDYATSVDQGAPNPQDSSYDKKLACITNCFHVFENAKTIYIAVDNDTNGRVLKDELIRRFGAEKCKLIDFGIYKDANEFLMYEDKEALAELISKAQPVPVSGIFTVDNDLDRLMDIYEFGLPKGTSTYFPSIDPHWTWRLGELNLITGYNNEGKSTMWHQLTAIKCMYDDWKAGLYVPENLPREEFWEEIIHQYIGKTTDPDYPNIRMSKKEFQKGIDFVREHFYLIDPEEDATFDVLLEKMSFLVRKQGIKIVTIDPWNKVKHLRHEGVRDDFYIGGIMSKLNKFAKQHMVCMNVILHPRTPEAPRGEDLAPLSRMSAKGGSEFSDHADNFIIIQRPHAQTDNDNPLVIFKSDKIRKQKLVGRKGQAELSFDWKSQRYLDPKIVIDGKVCSPFESDKVGIKNIQSSLDLPSYNYGMKKVETVVEEDTEEDLPF